MQPAETIASFAETSPFKNVRHEGLEAVAAEIRAADSTDELDRIAARCLELSTHERNEAWAARCRVVAKRLGRFIAAQPTA